MRTLNVNLYPRDGFFYKESDGTRIGGDTWAGVIRRVAAYRKRAGLPAGDPEREVTDQACTRSPVLCSEVDATTLKHRRIASIKGRLLKWLAGIRSQKAREGSLNFVDAEMAKRRADYCAGCVFNTPLPGGCGTCTAAVNEIRKELLGPKRRLDPRVAGCNMLGEDCVVSTHLDEVRVDNSELPGHCWRKIGGS